MTWSLFRGARAPANPWEATGLEWQTPSPPPTENFVETPVVTEEPYDYPPPEDREHAPMSEDDRSASNSSIRARAIRRRRRSAGMWLFLATEVLFFGGLFLSWMYCAPLEPGRASTPARAKPSSRSARSTPPSW